MRRTLWKANIIAFISSFCVMVIELIAARIMAPYIGVSLYTWTSIIGVILAGIALGNYLGGKLADRYPSPLALAAIFFGGGLLTIAILPATKIVTTANLFGTLPVMLNFVLKTTCIFFLPAIVLSMVSPVVIKLALADLGRTGGVVGTIYACSTAGAILGTFMTGFLFILWFGTRMIVWLVAAVLLLTGIVSWFAWKVPDRWRLSFRNLLTWLTALVVVLTSVILYRYKEAWQQTFTRESNYYAIRVIDFPDGVKALRLDYLDHSYINPEWPAILRYSYLKVFSEVVGYWVKDNPAPRLLHLGGGGYAFPRYMEAVWPGSINEVVEIDPAVTQVAHEKLGLPYETSIKTYNQDARLFLAQRTATAKYDIVIGDVFNDLSTPYHLTTLEFDGLVKANMNERGIYLINIIDDYRNGKYMPSFIFTLKQVFKQVYLFGVTQAWGEGRSTFVIAATDWPIDLTRYQQFVTQTISSVPQGNLHDTAKLEEYLTERQPILLTDDHAPTDILVARYHR